MIFIILAILLLAVIGLSIRDHIKERKAKREIKLYNSMFYTGTPYRIISENNGHGNYYYPQFFLDGDWLYFHGWFMSTEYNISFTTFDEAKDYIDNALAKIKPITKVVYEGNTIEK